MLDSDAYQSALATIKAATRDNGIDFLLSQHGVDVLIGPAVPYHRELMWLTGTSGPLGLARDPWLQCVATPI